MKCEAKPPASVPGGALKAAREGKRKSYIQLLLLGSVFGLPHFTLPRIQEPQKSLAFNGGDFLDEDGHLGLLDRATVAFDSGCGCRL